MNNQCEGAATVTSMDDPNVSDCLRINPQFESGSMVYQPLDLVHAEFTA